MKIEIEISPETAMYLEILAKHQETDLKGIVEQCAYNIATGVRRSASHEGQAVASMFGFFEIEDTTVKCTECNENFFDNDNKATVNNKLKLVYCENCHTAFDFDFDSNNRCIPNFSKKTKVIDKRPKV